MKNTLIVKTKLILGLAAVCLTANMTFADLLVDRGLPTANLNDAAGANRSNVSWVQYPTSGDNTAANYFMVGDTFQNTSSQTWNINQITLWTDGGTTAAASLWGGVQGSTIGVVQSSGVILDATYPGATGANLLGNQGHSGAYYPLQQVDFAVNITLAPGQTYDFFFDGSDPFSGYGLPFVEASNAALSGSPQVGADGTMLVAEVINGALDPTSIATWDSNGDGWNRSTDVNVDVFGSSVPDGGMTVMLLGGSLMSLAALRRKLFF